MRTHAINPATNSARTAVLADGLLKGNTLDTVGIPRIARAGFARKPGTAPGIATEDPFRRLFESHPHPMWVYDLETLRFLAVNAAALAQYGYTRDEFLELTIKELCLPEHVLRLLDSLDDIRYGHTEPGPRTPALWRHRRKDGTNLDVEIVTRPLAWNKRRAELVIARDVSELLRAGRQSTLFARAAASLNAAVTAEQVAQIVVGVAGELFGWDACLFCLYNAAHDEARSVISVDIVNGRKVDVPLASPVGRPSPFLQYVIENGSQLILRDTADVMPVAAEPFGDTTRLSASLMGVPIRLGTDTLGVLSIQSYTSLAYDEAALDNLQRLADLGAGALTRIKALESLHAAEARSRLLSENQSEGLCVLDGEDRFISVNPAAERLFGAASGALLNRTLGEFISAEQREFVRYQTERRLRGEPVAFDLSITPAGGETRVLHVTVAPQKDATGHHPQALCVFHDITRQKHAELLVAQTHLRLQTVWDAARVPMRLTDAAGTIVMVNRAYCDLVGLTRERVEGQPLSVVFSPASQEQALEDHARRFERDDHLPHRTTELTLWNGRQVFLEIAETFLSLPGHSPMLLSVIRDTTDQRQMEAQLRQMQRLESIGQLAAGVAHDFNNILGVIQGEASLLLMDAGDGSAAAEPVRQIQQAADRAASLTRQLLLFSRQQTLQLAPVNLNQVVESMAKLLKRLLGEQITTRFAFAPAPTTVLADVGMMEQVLVNLCVNARDAMPKGGSLLVETSRVEASAKDLERLPEARPGPHVCLTVTDTGTGILPEARPHIFEPFYTTKKEGKGTGLGLATVYGIVKQHHGWVTVDTEVGKGTTFRVLLPYADEPAAPSQPLQPQTTPADVPGMTILAVEDEAILREVNCAVLQRHGYRVLTAESGPQALELVKAGARIDLLLTDMVMPGEMTGRDLARVLQARQPELRVLYTSGYSSGMGDTTFLRRADTHFLPKPYTAETLCQKVAECLQPKRNEDGHVPANGAQKQSVPQSVLSQAPQKAQTHGRTNPGGSCLRPPEPQRDEQPGCRS